MKVRVAAPAAFSHLIGCAGGYRPTTRASSSASTAAIRFATFARIARSRAPIKLYECPICKAE